jgi:putative ABC transport system ATP-binding protein
MHTPRMDPADARPASRPALDGPIVVLKGVGKEYPVGGGTFWALRDVDLAVHSGEFVAVVGKSGSGKSTLLNLLAGIDRATRGELRVAGTVLGDLAESPLAVWRGSAVGVVFQFFQLLPTLTVLENVILPMEFLGRLRSAQTVRRARELLEEMGVADQADKLPSELSGGQQQRVAIARALANDPPIIVADEPTGNLDSQTADDILRRFQRLAHAGKTVLMVTHERDVSSYVTRVVRLVDGRVVEASHV